MEEVVLKIRMVYCLDMIMNEVQHEQLLVFMEELPNPAAAGHWPEIAKLSAQRSHAYDIYVV